MLSAATQIVNAQQTATATPQQHQQQNNLDALDETGGESKSNLPWAHQALGKTIFFVL
jgi:hypothetical protein